MPETKWHVVEAVAVQPTIPTVNSPSPNGGRLGVEDRLAILDALPGALVVADSNETIVYANDRAMDLLQSTLVGRALEDYIASTDHLRSVEAEAESAGRRASIRVVVQGRSPLELGFQVADLSVRSNSECCTLVAFQDIGWYLRIRGERDALLKHATVGAVLPSILHELKNPLASVTSAVELLVEEAQPGELQNDLHAILSEVRRMKLGFEGIGIAGRTLLSNRNCTIDLALREAVQVFQGRAKRDGISIECRIANLPLLPLDEAVVRALAFNLVNNALHACKPGDTITVSGRLENEGRYFVLEIVDTGSGMDSETISRCTQLFYTTKNSGSGIGLALCKNTIDSAGGDFEIVSELGKGTSIEIRVPLKTIEQGQPEERKRK